MTAANSGEIGKFLVRIGGEYSRKLGSNLLSVTELRLDAYAKRKSQAGEWKE